MLAYAYHAFSLCKYHQKMTFKFLYGDLSFDTDYQHKKAIIDDVKLLTTHQ